MVNESWTYPTAGFLRFLDSSSPLIVRENEGRVYSEGEHLSLCNYTIFKGDRYSTPFSLCVDSTSSKLMLLDVAVAGLILYRQMRSYFIDN